jgi:DNA primase
LAIDSDLVRQVKEANDIVEVIGGYLALRPVGATFKGLCPFHDDHRPSFDVDPRRQRYRCWPCQKSGDVISFIQEHDRVEFREALEVLARRAGISLEKIGEKPPDSGRALMLEVVRWAAEQYQQCLLDDPLGEAARKYLGERKLTGETVRRFGLGFAPPHGDWLVKRAAQSRIAFDVLETVGLIARRNEGSGHYDRFRDRLMFPIRNVRAQAVGFGGRILPTSLLLKKETPPPKYYNSAETPLFSKSAQLYGIDQARQAGTQAGYLAVVEGYTDVLMAHQCGISQVVATMGTALNARHVQQLRRFVPRVVLVFDADAGGNKGVDRALEIFVSEDVELAIATLPEGLDPCDLLVKEGPEPLRQALAGAVDALDFKLNQLLGPNGEGVEGRRKAVDDLLRLIALAPALPGEAGRIKHALILNRIAQRLGLKEEMLLGRLKELAEQSRRPEPAPVAAEPPRVAPASKLEVQFLEVLLGHPELVAAAALEVPAEEIEHPGLRRLAEGLYILQAAGKRPDLDGLRPSIELPRLVEKALEMQERGRAIPDAESYLKKLAAEFRRKRTLPQKRELENRLRAAPDDVTAINLLRQLQNQEVGSDS